MDFYSQGRRTTLVSTPRLSDALGANVTLAVEALQLTGSFKFRAAYNVAFTVPNPKVITASSGNFGQAIAYACKLAGKACTVVMPDNSAAVKVNAVREYGATVDLIETTKVSRAERVRQLAEQSPEAYIASAYDDPLVIAGNSTLGVELAEIMRGGTKFDAVLVPIGGGGLAAGVVTGLRKSGNDTPVFAVEPLLGNDVAQSLRAGKIIRNEQEPQTMADGARTVSVGVHNWVILQHGLAGIFEVTEENIAKGVRTLFGLANVKAEPTGALTTGALLQDPERFRGKSVCCIVSGGNVDPAVYAALLTG